MKKIFGLLPRLLLVLALLPLVGINLAMAYIMFAPDTLPKPFYLMYQVPEPPAAPTEQPVAGKPSTSGSAAAVSAVQEPATAHAAAADSVPTTSLELKPGQGLMVDTGTKIVNLVDPTGRRYLRVGIVLEFAPNNLAYYSMTPEEKTAFSANFNEEITAKLPIINDIIIGALSSQTFEDVYTADGKENLRKNIIETISKQLPEYQVIFVYFTEFVVQ